MPQDKETPRGPTRWARAATLLLLGLTQALFVWGLLGPGPLLGGEPLIEDDYALHLATAQHPLRGTYSPYHMAGHPTGTVDAVSNRPAQLLYALLPGTPGPRAFALLISTLFLLPPFLGYATARAIGGNLAAAAATGVCFALLFAGFTAGPRPYLHYGMYTHALLLPGAAWVVAVATGRPSRRRFLWLTGGLVAGIALHPFFALLVVPPFVCLSISSTTHRAHGVFLAASGLIALALHGGWITALLRDLRLWGLAAAPFFQGTLEAAGEELTSPTVLLWLGGAAGVHWLWRHGSRAAALGLASGALAPLIVGALGEVLPGAAWLEPERFLDAVTFFTVPPAIVAAQTAVRRGRRTRLLITAAGLTALALPSWHWVATVGGQERLLSWNGESTGDSRLQPDSRALVAALPILTTPRARILIEDSDHDQEGHRYGDSHLLAYLPWIIDRELIGGPVEETRLVHRHASFTQGSAFGRPVVDFSDPELFERLEVYNVGWIVTFSAAGAAGVQGRPYVHELEPLGGFRLFEVSRRHGFVEGSPTTRVDAEVGSLRVTGAPTGVTLLRYHWDPRWAVDPPLALRRVHRADDPVGFIAVENGSVLDFDLALGS